MAGERHNFRQALWKWVEKNIILDLAWTQSHYLVKRLLLEWGQLLSTFGASSSTKLQECLWWAPGSAEAPDWLQQLKPWAGGVSVNSWMSSLQHWCLCGLENKKKRKKKKSVIFTNRKLLKIISEQQLCSHSPWSKEGRKVDLFFPRNSCLSFLGYDEALDWLVRSFLRWQTC